MKQLLEMTSLISMHFLDFHKSEVTDLIRGFVIFMCVETSIMRSNSSDLVLDFTAYTTEFIHPERQ